MDRMFELQKIESLRKMILLQEEIFRQQVQELHRLYNLQKKLMQELENSGIIKRPKAKAPHNLQSFMARDYHYELGLQTPAQSTSNITIHPSGQNDDCKKTHEENEVEVELTLGIGRGPVARGSKNEANTTNPVQETGSCSRRDNRDEYGEPGLSMNNSSSSSTRFQENNTRPHWLVRDLGSNRT